MQNLILQSAPSANKTSASDTLSGLSNTQSNSGVADVKQESPLFASLLKKQVGHHALKVADGMSDKLTATASTKDKSTLTKPQIIDDQLSADADNVNLLELTTQVEPSIKTTAKAKSIQKDIEEAQSKQDSLVAQMGLPAMLSLEQKPINAVKNSKEVVNDDELTKEDLNTDIEAQADILGSDEKSPQSIEGGILATNTLKNNDALASQTLVAQSKVVINAPVNVKDIANDDVVKMSALAQTEVTAAMYRSDAAVAVRDSKAQTNVAYPVIEGTNLQVAAKALKSANNIDATVVKGLARDNKVDVTVASKLDLAIAAKVAVVQTDNSNVSAQHFSHETNAKVGEFIRDNKQEPKLDPKQQALEVSAQDKQSFAVPVAAINTSNVAKAAAQQTIDDGQEDANIASMAAAVVAPKSDVAPNADKLAKGLAQNVASNDRTLQNSDVKAAISNANTAPDSKSNSFKAMLANETTLNVAANNDVAAANIQSNQNLNRPEFSTTTSTNVMATQVGKTDYIDTYFGKAGWTQAVNQQVMLMVGKGDESVTLTLNPPELGPLQVVLKMGNDQVDTTFISDSPEVRQALQDGMHHLKDKMNESGIQLGNTNISSNAQSQQDFQQAMQGREQAASSRYAESVEAESIKVTPTVIKAQTAKGLVDTFA